MEQFLKIQLFCLFFLCGTGNGVFAIETNLNRPLTWKNPITGMKFVLVKGGCYWMGDPSTPEEEYNGIRYYRHQVCVDDFYIGKYEVTQAQWHVISPYNTAHFTEYGGDYPMEQVSWWMVQQYIEDLNERSEGTFRLPTEAEWEYAARSGGGFLAYPTKTGEIDFTLANYRPNLLLGGISDDYDETAPVGKFPANGVGIHDMGGNVWEWVQDYYNSEYYKKSPQKNPKGPQSGYRRVIRGGSWANSYDEQQSVLRRAYPPSKRDYRIGFRLVGSWDGIQFPTEKTKTSDSTETKELENFLREEEELENPADFMDLNQGTSSSSGGDYAKMLGGVNLKLEGGAATVSSSVTDVNGEKREIAKGENAYSSISLAFKSPYVASPRGFGYTIYPQIIASSIVIADFRESIPKNDVEGTETIPVEVTDYETGQLVDPEDPNTYQIDIQSLGLVGEINYTFNPRNNLQWFFLLGVGTSLLEYQTVNVQLGSSDESTEKWEGFRYYTVKAHSGFAIHHIYFGMGLDYLHYPNLSIPENIEFRDEVVYNAEKQIYERGRVFVGNVDFDVYKIVFNFNYPF